ncbi:odorant receptor coreceptor-like isoform X1 [Lycorma delicatula]|uniref:odorant receptor coreceptor-like isoform X1 n=1 Tax=Lycorma delicatula TaxID=130591 RepID=UPI003F50D584
MYIIQVTRLKNDLAVLTLLKRYYAYVTYFVCIISMQEVVNDIKLLCLSVREMLIPKNGENSCQCSIEEINLKNSAWILVQEDDENGSFSEDNIELIKSYTRYIIMHHQLIYKRVSIINKGIPGASITTLCLSIGYACLSVYSLVKKSSLISKLTEVPYCAFLFYLIYLFDVRGERMTTEWENLRNVLYDCQWINKPTWFKKMLLIMMTQNNKKIEIKPFGITALNLNNFAVSINAVYTYFNVLTRFESNQTNL